MRGNISEWYFDDYDEKAYRKRSGITKDPVVTGGFEFRVPRGVRFADACMGV